jgi:ATP-dependent RNA circularization protein (DNA/RNA ligase family)
VTDFFRFPHTPHLAWLGSGSPRDDKVLTSETASKLLAGTVVVEEKVDGANLGISIDFKGTIRFQNRGQYLVAPFSGQFSRLRSWIEPREDALRKLLQKNLILFGEWCAARHSVHYTKLPDWLLAFDVYDRDVRRFWDVSRRDAFAKAVGIFTTPQVFSGKATVSELKNMILCKKSRFWPGPMEGIVVRREEGDWADARAKLVHPGFCQGIVEHWSRRSMEWNRVLNSGG